MDTMTIRAAATSVTGARHLRIARNGQDAAVAWFGEMRRFDGSDLAAGTSVFGARDSARSRADDSALGDSARSSADDSARLRSGDAAVVVVCDGCSSGASSEVGARLG